MERGPNEEYRERMFLENFIEFGALHRARVAYECLQRFKRFKPGNDSVRASLALEILQTYLNTFEDVGIWITVIPKWIRDGRPLVQLMASRATQAERRPRMRPRFSARQQLVFAGAYSMPDTLARSLRLPYRDHEFDSWGIAEQQREPLRAEFKELARLFNVFFWEAEKAEAQPDARDGLPRRDATGAIYYDLAPWTILNRIKHGLLVTLSESTTWGPGVCVHTNPEDFGQYWELNVNYYYLVKLVAVAFLGCLFLGRLLSLVYWARYHAAPSVSWLEASFRLNLKRLDPYQMGRVLRACRVPRRQDIVPPQRDTARFVEPTLFGELSANWWRGHPL